MTNAELLAAIERRAVCVHRDGRHYVPLFVPNRGLSGVGKPNELEIVLSALRGVEAARDVLVGIKANGELASVSAEGPFSGYTGGKKPQSKEVFQFPRWMLTDIDEAIAALSEVTP